MSRSAAAIDKLYYDIDAAAEYLQRKGFDVNKDSIDYYYRRTEKLAKPKRLGRKVYWHRSQLDDFIENL